MSSSRSQARRLALQVLYALEYSGESLGGIPEHVHAAAPKASEPIREYALELVQGIITQREILDAAIDAAIEHWSMERIHPIERNILRIGMYELTYRADVPGKVSIDEAVGLARQFGDEAAWRLINGILDRYGKERLSAESSDSSQTSIESEV